MHVLALPQAGPLDPDARRILRLAMPAQISILLREDRIPPAGYGPAIPLSSLGAVEDFFASLTWSGSMYGRKFLEAPALAGGWPAQPSLALDIRPVAAPHLIYGFNECEQAQTGAASQPSELPRTGRPPGGPTSGTR
jgi:hypothetical protein